MKVMELEDFYRGFWQAHPQFNVLLGEKSLQEEQILPEQSDPNTNKDEVTEVADVSEPQNSAPADPETAVVKEENDLEGEQDEEISEITPQ